MASYRLTDPAQEDLLALATYIAQESVPAARRVVDELEVAMEGLAEMPGKGHIREDLTDEAGLLFWPVHSYLIVYQSESRPLEIMRILHGRRDVEAVLRR